MPNSATARTVSSRVGARRKRSDWSRDDFIASTPPRVRLSTVKKRIGAIQTLLSFAERERWIDGNVGARVTVDGAGKAKTSRRTFRQDELQELFASDLFLHPENLVSRRTAISDLTLFWLFLLGLTSGARIEEIGQAHLSDVRTEAGIHYIDITEYVDEGDLEKERSEKSLSRLGKIETVPRFSPPGNRGRCCMPCPAPGPDWCVAC